jgi:hypothetical protein
MIGWEEDTRDAIVPGSALDGVAALLGPGFVRRRSRCWNVFKDLVFSAKFGGNAEGTGGSDGGWDRGLKYFIRSPHADNRIYLEDPVDAVLKIIGRGRVDRAGGISGVLLSDLEKCALLFRQAASEEDTSTWLSYFESGPDSQAVFRDWNATRSTFAAFERMLSDAPPLSEPAPCSSSATDMIVSISNENLVSLARLASCLTVDCTCYNRLRRISASFINAVVATVSTGLGRHDVVRCEEVNGAFCSLGRNVVIGYGFNG